MSRGPLSFEAAVRAFRDATATAAEGSATRARVLARASRTRGRHAALRRVSLLAAGALVALASVSAAFTAGRWWRAPASAALTDGATVAPERSRSGRPLRVIPAAALAPAPVSGGTAGAEDRAYGRAHRAHFVDDAPARALAAWDDYLGAYPDGAFAPEARYNRALCLARLGRFADAARALRPFARGRPGAYRQREAAIVLEWLHDR